MSYIVYYGFKVGLVILWIYFGLRLSESVGLNIYDIEHLTRASDQLVAIYLFFWLCAIVMLAVKAHMEAERRFEDEIRFKNQG